MDRWDIAPFLFKSLPQNEIRAQWMRWKRNFEYVAAASEEKNKTKLKFLLLARAGPDVQEIFQAIPGADVEENEANNIDPYRVALSKLDEYFAPKHHESMERNIFWTLKPENGENLEKFMLRAREQAYKCNFGTSQQESRDICVIDKITLLAPPDLKEKLLQKDQLSLDEVFKIVASHQSVKYQASQMVVAGPSGLSQPMIAGEVNRMYTPSSNRATLECSRCGRKGHFANDRICPARDKPCNQCKRIGHFARKCKVPHAKGSTVDTSNRPMKYASQRIRAIPLEEEEPKNEIEGLQSFIFSIGDGDEFIWLKIGGVMMQALIDSGCNKNIIDDVTWDRLKAQGIAIRNATKHVDHKFRGYGKDCKPMDVVGMFDAMVEVDCVDHQTNSEARFYVIKDGNQPLLGKDTARELNVLRLGPPIQEDGVFKVSSLGFIVVVSCLRY